jgi:HAD superfamily hydrolase (TIGR01549 family)
MFAEPLNLPQAAVMVGVRNPVDPTARVRAVLFDLDGTLYRQAPLRALMALELTTILPLKGPGRAPRRLRMLAAYRRAQEQLREQGAAEFVAMAQLQRAARDAGVPVSEVEALVEEWMIRRPLKYLRRLRAAGLVEILSLLDRQGVPAGVFSDYPAEAKIEALGLSGRFAFALASSDPKIGAFKPHPSGFLRACEYWRLHPREVLMVGDRADTDAAGAAAAGMPCVIIGRGRSSGRYRVLPSLERLSRALDDRRTS